MPLGQVVPYDYIPVSLLTIRHEPGAAYDDEIGFDVFAEYVSFPGSRPRRRAGRSFPLPCGTVYESGWSFLGCQSTSGFSGFSVFPYQGHGRIDNLIISVPDASSRALADSTLAGLPRAGEVGDDIGHAPASDCVAAVTRHARYTHLDVEFQRSNNCPSTTAAT